MIYRDVRSLIKNLKKKKFKSIFRVFWDSQYRHDIRYMKTLVQREERQVVKGLIKIGAIKLGHDINYPQWVRFLFNQLDAAEGLIVNLPPIKVVWDPKQLSWLVVDGNHRLRALQMYYPGNHQIEVDILEPKWMIIPTTDFTSTGEV